MLTDLTRPSLQSRCRICDLGMFFKIHRGQVNISLPYDLTSVPVYGRSRASHDFKIRLSFSSVDTYKHCSFYVISIPVRNALSADVVRLASYPGSSTLQQQQSRPVSTDPGQLLITEVPVPLVFPEIENS